MKRFSWPLLVSLVLLSCRTVRERPGEPPGGAADSLRRATEALGGVDTLAGVKTFLLKGTVREWEPEQSKVADGESLLASDSTFESLADFAAGAVRVDWVRNFFYPQVRTYKFSEVVTPAAGYVAGIDATARTKQSLESNPPAHTMSGLRLAASQRELLRSSPVLV